MERVWARIFVPRCPDGCPSSPVRSPAVLGGASSCPARSAAASSAPAFRPKPWTRSSGFRPPFGRLRSSLPCLSFATSASVRLFCSPLFWSPYPLRRSRARSVHACARHRPSRRRGAASAPRARSFPCSRLRSTPPITIPRGKSSWPSALHRAWFRGRMRRTQGPRRQLIRALLFVVWAGIRPPLFRPAGDAQYSSGTAGFAM